MNLIDRVLPLRIDRGAGEKHVRMGLRCFQHIIIADHEFCMCSVKQTGLVIVSVHSEEHGLLYVFRRAKFCDEMFKIPRVGFSRMGRGEFLFPEQESKERAVEHLRRNIAPIVAVRQGCEVNMAVDERFLSDHELAA